MMNYPNWLQAKSNNAERIFSEDSQKYRDNFQKDRDRILYSKSFRRLSGKTQVFLTGQNDHLRTRLTHSLEVNQIARTISNALNLNIDLTEAIALGHDIGHTPFGHIGERTLNFIMNGCEQVKDFNINLKEDNKGFKHNVQALRILTDLEQSKEQYDGLNLSKYTLWGIVNHTKYKSVHCGRTTMQSENEEIKKCYFSHVPTNCNQNGELSLSFYKKYLDLIPDSTCWSFEGLVVRIADEIAQRHHDIEDAIFTGLIDRDSIIDLIEETFKEFFTPKIAQSFKELKDLKDQSLLSSYVSRFIVNFLITQIITDAKRNIKYLFYEHSIKNATDLFLKKPEIITQSKIFELINYNPNFQVKEKEFQDYLKNKILNSYVAQKMDGKAEFIIRKLFHAYVSNPQQLPDKTIMVFAEYFLGKEYFEKARIKYTEKNFIGCMRGELKLNFERNDMQEYKHALLRSICDHIAGMTDNYAYNQYELLYGSTRIFQ